MPRRRWRRTVGLALILGGLLFAGVSVAVGLRLAAPSPATLPPPPAGAEEVVFPSESGSLLHGWIWRGSSCGSVVLMHPVRANRTAMLERGAFLRDRGHTVLLFDFQAHGESAGSHITFGHLESRDAATAVEFLKQVRPGEPVAAVGSSLGGAAAVVGSEPLPVDGLVLEAVYPTLHAAVDNRIRMRLGPLSDVLTPVLLLEMRAILGFGPEEQQPARSIARLRQPVLIIAGSEDRHTTPDDTQRLFDAAPEPKDLWLLDGVAHVDFFRADPAAYRDRVGGFLSGILQCERSPSSTRSGPGDS